MDMRLILSSIPSEAENNFFYELDRFKKRSNMCLFPAPWQRNVDSGDAP
jgi:hypothetical protein